MVPSLKEVEAMVDALAPADQVRLLRYLVPRLADAVLSQGAPADDNAERAWQEYRRVGRRLASTPAGPNLTQAISDMRR